MSSTSVSAPGRRGPAEGRSDRVDAPGGGDGRRAARQRLRRAHRAERGPPGRRGAGHRLHVLRVEGPPRRRGVLAPAADASPAHRSTAVTTPATRVSDALRDLARLVADEPELAAASTTAILAPDPDVQRLRNRIGAAFNQRLATALGEDADPAVLRALEPGAGRRAAAGGHGVLQLRRPRRPHGRGRGPAARWVRPMTATDLVYSPYEYEIHEDPYPTYAAPARRGAGVPQRRAAASGRCPATPTWWRAFRDNDALLVGPRRVARPGRVGPARPPHDVVPRHGPARCTGACAASCRAGSRPRRVAELEPRIRELTREHLDVALAKGTFDFIGDLAGKLPMDVI